MICGRTTMPRMKKNNESHLILHAKYDTMHADFTKERCIAMTTSLTIRMDEALKAEAEDFFEDIGMNLTTAITCFFKKCLDIGEIPFRLGRSDRVIARLLSALNEAKETANDPSIPACTDEDKLEEFLKS